MTWRHCLMFRRRWRGCRNFDVIRLGMCKMSATIFWSDMRYTQPSFYCTCWVTSVKKIPNAFFRSTTFIHGYCLIITYMCFLTMKGKCNCVQIESQCPHSMGALRHAKISQLKQCLDVAGYHLFIRPLLVLLSQIWGCVYIIFIDDTGRENQLALWSLQNSAA